MAQHSKQNSEFLLNLLLEENHCLYPIDFIDRNNKSTNFCCVCVSLGVADKYDELRSSFENNDSFSKSYFNVYIDALENYRCIVQGNDRQILFDEAKIFYPKEFKITSTNNLVSNEENKNAVLNFLEELKTNHTYAIILRDDIAFVVIHQQNDNFIIIDPHVECCGLLSKNGVYRYVVYDGVWDFNINMLTEKVNMETN